MEPININSFLEEVHCVFCAIDTVLLLFVTKCFLAFVFYQSSRKHLQRFFVWIKKENMHNRSANSRLAITQLTFFKHTNKALLSTIQGIITGKNSGE
jgi:hypothetical protein